MKSKMNNALKHSCIFRKLSCLFVFALMLSPLVLHAQESERCHGYCFLLLVGQGQMGYEYLVQDCATCTDKHVLCAGIISTPQECKNCKAGGTCEGAALPAGCSLLIKPGGKSADEAWIDQTLSK